MSTGDKTLATFSDSQFSTPSYHFYEIEHRYGNKIHILKNPLALYLLAKLCSRETKQPQITYLVRELYRLLSYEVIAKEFPTAMCSVKTRMYEKTQKAVWQGTCLSGSPSVVVVALARAGLLPSQSTYEFLTQIFEPDLIRQDHLALGRILDPEGRVMGSGLQSSKIGGTIQDSFLMIPDPMGATGSTVGQVLKHYSSHIEGKAQKTIALHLIITPEYIRYIKKNHPDVEVYALRLDRGLSDEKILQSVPGSYLEQEKGLTEQHYIIPGAGGIGEVLNNSNS